MVQRFLRVIPLLIISLLTASCAGDGPTGGTQDARVLINFLTPSTVRQVAVSVSGPGITPAITRNISIGADTTARDTIVLTAGAGRRFVISAYDSTGIETHRADTTLNLIAGVNPPLAVRLMPLSSTVGITVTFGGVRLTVTDTSTRTLSVGDTLRIGASGVIVGTGGNAAVAGDSLRWGSGNPAVAQVSAGLIRAVAPGSAWVSLSFRNASAAVRVIVVAASQVGVNRYLAAGGSHTCGVTALGRAYCWGRNTKGQLGDATLVNRDAPVAVTGTAEFAAITGGFEFTCGLLLTGGVSCWGANAEGQLGNGGTTATSTPTAVSGSQQFTSVTAGAAHTCALTTAGEAYCWGWNQWGQLGDGTTVNRAVPTRVGGSQTFTALSASWHSTCGLTGAGDLYCWGDNTYGELGDGTTVARTSPAIVAGGRKYRSISQQEFGHACAVAVTGGAYCWGLNDAGQIGDGTLVSRSAPTSVTSGGAFTMTSAGGNHTCALTSTGAASCWGYNLYGQLGNGSTTNAGTPQPITGRLFSTLVTGAYFTCGLDFDGAAFCWGVNGTSELGIGTTGNRSVPTAVVGGLRFGRP